MLTELLSEFAIGKSMKNQPFLFTDALLYLCKSLRSKAVQFTEKEIKRRLYDITNVMIQIGVLNKTCNQLGKKRKLLSKKGAYSINKKAMLVKKILSERESKDEIDITEYLS